MTLDAAAIAHVARIARLELTDEERARFAAEAAAILAHFEAVAAADGGEEAPPEPAMAPRPDEPRDPDAAEVAAMVAEFPRSEGRLAKVPRGL